jgi:cellulose synthase operon protein YhjU
MMGLWSVYFFGKLFLYYHAYIKFDLLYNFAFAVFLLVDAPEESEFRKPLRIAKGIVAFMAAIALLWHDTWFPPPQDAWYELVGQGIPTKEYIYSFLLRYYDQQTMINIGIIFALCWVANKFLRMSTFVLMAMIAVVPFKIMNQPNADELTMSVDAFFDSEQTRMIHFKKPGSAGLDFDVVILHVCSLSWDDLKEAKMEEDPFFRQFHYLFTNYNTATTYSGPAVIRLLRASCGQSRHSDLYKDQPKECYLFRGLESVGFDTEVTLNHDGKYGSFAQQILENGLSGSTPMPLESLPLYLLMFDDSPIYDDYATLEKWWKNRMASGKPATALYYNTVTLHDGTHRSDDKQWWKAGREGRYREYLTKLFADMSKFFRLMAESGRNVVVVFAPEHGMALRGSVMQAAGLRDIPLPKITNVPVGIKLIGPAFNGEKVRQKRVDKPASYLAISYMLAEFTEKSPFLYENYLTDSFVDTIPQTDFVAENESSMIARIHGKHYYYGKEKKWLEFSEKELE